MSISTLIIGLGQIGMGYDLHLDPADRVYSHARAFQFHPEFQLVGGVDPSPARRQLFEETFQAPGYPNLVTACDAQSPELIVIATPTLTHGSILAEAISQRSLPKAILCEKPLSYDLQEARKMVSSCSDKDIGIYVNYMRRSDPGVIETKRRLDHDLIEKPVKGVVWYSKGLVHNGSHFLNLLEYWLGPQISFQILDRGRVWNNIDPEPDVRVTFSRGSVIFLSGWEESYSHYTVELLAHNGRLRYERGGEKISWQPITVHPELAAYRVLSDEEIIPSGMSRYQWNVAEQLASALKGRPYHLCSGAEALGTLINVRAILDKL